MFTVARSLCLGCLEPRATLPGRRLHDLSAAATGGAEVAQHVRIVGFNSIAELVAAERACAWTLGGMLDDAQFARLLAEAETTLRPFVTVDGAVEFTMPALNHYGCQAVRIGRGTDGTPPTVGYTHHGKTSFRQAGKAFYVGRCSQGRTGTPGVRALTSLAPSGAARWCGLRSVRGAR